VRFINGALNRLIVQHVPSAQLFWLIGGKYKTKPARDHLRRFFTGENRITTMASIRATKAMPTPKN
jgi:hypothetical protein